MTRAWRRLVRLALCAAAVLLAGDRAHHAVAQLPMPQPLTVVISDLHFGLGREASGWSPLEDFRWRSDFKPFLSALNAGGAGVTLVLAGDTFELWESEKADCTYRSDDWSCTEAEAVARLDRVLGNHRDEMGDLRAFASQPGHRLVIVPGNHDAALLFDQVRRRVEREIGGATEVRRDGMWQSTDGAVHVEHGHQIGEDLNRFVDWPRPFVGGEPPHIRRTWGEQFVNRFFTPFERKYPLVDNILENGIGAHYVMRAEGAVGTTAGAGRFFVFLLSKLSFAQYVRFTGGSGADRPAWDVKDARSQGDRFLVESMPPDSPLREATAQALSRGTLGVSIGDLSDEDISTICDYRAALQPRKGELVLAAAPPLCRPIRAGAIGAQLLQRSRDAAIAARIAELERSAGPQTPPVRAFVFGHTHQADQPRPVTVPETIRLKAVPTVVNTGAWHRVLTPQQVDRLKCDGLRSEAEVLRLEPEVLPACYSAVLIKPYARDPVPELLYWSRGPAGDWRLAKTCTWTPPCPR
jgi:UDP-2,3-diacylglucosamine pyrophosphatase LpxH